MPRFDTRPFEAIRPGLLDRIRPYVALIAEELAADPQADAVSAEARAWAAESLRLFETLTRDPGRAWPRVAATYREIGHGVALRGLDLGDLHTALHRGARAVWRALVPVAESLDLDGAALGAIAEAQFAYLDAVLAEAAAGHAAARTGAHELLHRRRVRLVGRLLDGADPRTLPEAARAADWRVPAAAAAVLLHPRAAEPRPLLLPPDVLVDPALPEPRLIVPDPDGGARARQLRALLKEWIVVQGPALPVPRLPESLTWARRALDLVRRGKIAADGVVRCMDHVPLLVVFAAEDLLDHAADLRLAPLAGLPPAQADRLARTLLVLLECNFNATEAGVRLCVHPQTIRFRLRRLEELLGTDLHDPRGCLELEMILRARYGEPAGSDSAKLVRPRTGNTRTPPARNALRTQHPFGAGHATTLSAGIS
ncbi:helix-turn-helix domain-containing protein [Actinomadura rayongensis]|uniref:PucR family transcriptional regulator n=1 Tax=Actinomadura rayongensis TaxID=1429076 RepID=UPI00301CEC3F